MLCVRIITKLISVQRFHFFLSKIERVSEFACMHEWEVTHLEIELTKEAAKEILGARTAIRNTLAISALGKGSECCTSRGIEIEVSKAKLHVYLRPP